MSIVTVIVYLLLLTLGGKPDLLLCRLCECTLPHVLSTAWSRWRGWTSVVVYQWISGIGEWLLCVLVLRCPQLYQGFPYAPFHYVAIDVSLSCTALGIEKDRENIVPEGSLHGPSSHVHLNEYVWNMCAHSGGTERPSEVDLYTV